MKHLLIICSLLLTSFSWSQGVHYYDLVKRDGLYYENYSDGPFTGSVIGEFQGKIINGKKEGQFVRYYESGKLKSKINFKDNKLEGEWLYYYDNGQLMDKHNFKDGKKNCGCISYHENGQLWMKTNYKDGKRDGEQLFYNENGKLYKTEIWKDHELIE